MCGGRTSLHLVATQGELDTQDLELCGLWVVYWPQPLSFVCHLLPEALPDCFTPSHHRKKDPGFLLCGKTKLTQGGQADAGFSSAAAL